MSYRWIARTLGLGTLILGFNNANAAAGRIKHDGCKFKARINGKWQDYNGSFTSGTRVEGRALGSSVAFQLLSGPRGIFATHADCVEFVGASSRSRKSSQTPSKTYLTVHGAPQYFKAKFSVLNSLSQRVDVVGTVLGAALGVGVIKTLGAFQFGGTVIAGIGKGSAKSSAAEYTANYVLGIDLFVPVEVYYAFGRSALGVSAGLQYLKLNWPVQSPNPDTTQPDSRFTYLVDAGYRFMGDGFFINPRVGLVGSGGLFAELRGGVAF